MPTKPKRRASRKRLFLPQPARANGAKRGPGHPTVFDPRFVQQAYKLALLGLKHDEMATVFDVSESTIDKWKVAHPEFLRAIRDGGLIADAEIVNVLRQKALGGVKAEKIFYNPKIGEVVRAKHLLAPDTLAAIYWLNNRQPQFWRQRQDITTDGKAFQAFADAAVEASKDLEKRLRVSDDSHLRKGG